MRRAASPTWEPARRRAPQLRGWRFVVAESCFAATARRELADAPRRRCVVVAQRDGRGGAIGGAFGAGAVAASSD